MQTPQSKDREAFALELGRALQHAGTPSHRLEELLTGVCERLGLQAQFFSTPTSLWAGFGPPESQRTLLARTEPAELNLHRLYLVDQLVGRVARDEITITDARQQLRDITASPPRYPRTLQPIAFAAASATVAIFFGSSLLESACAALLGILIGLLLLYATARRDLARLLDFAAGFTATAGAIGLSHINPEINAPTVTLAGLIVLVPGLTLTLAVSELAARHLVSGTARLMHAVMIIVSIGFGVALGRAVIPLPDDTLGSTLAPRTALYAALFVAPIAFTVIFNARLRDLPVIAITSLAAFTSARVGSDILGPELGASAGAFTAGLVANAQARIRRVPATIASIPGIMLLVPGSLGMRSFEALLADDAIQGLDGAFSVLLIAVGIVAGLLLANAALPSRQAL